MKRRRLTCSMALTGWRFACVSLIICTPFTTGCRQHNAPTQSSTDDGKSLTYAGKKWALSGPCLTDHRLVMNSFCYTTDDDNIRLVKHVPRENPEEFEIITLQINHNGRWVNHGLEARRELDGSRHESHWIYGELHGTVRQWYPNGQLHIEREYVNDLMNGRERGWYSDGKPMYDVINVNGKEVSGEFWNKDGTTR